MEDESDWGISDKKELLCVVIKQIPGNKVKPTLGRSVDKSYFTPKYHMQSKCSIEHDII